MDQRRPPHERPNPPPSGEFDLELDEIEADAALRAKRGPSKAAPPEELLDLTFTKPGESLHASKTAYNRATSTAQSRLTWRRMREDFRSLGASGKLVVRAVVGVAVLLFAFWLMRVVWRGAVYAVNSGAAVARGVAGTLQPNVGAVQESGQQFIEKMRQLWNDVQSEGNELAGVAAPQRVETQQVEGDAWPAREEDQLASSDLAVPTELISSLLVHKGIALTPDGLGVFHIDEPMPPEKPSWIGGFGLLKRKGGSPKALLHGTVVHHEENGDVLVARFRQGEMNDFWMLEGPAEKRVVVYVRMIPRGGKAVPDGGAFVLDSHRTTALALAYESGAPIGAQWCTKKRDEKGAFVLEPPADILSMSELRGSSPESQGYLQYLEKALERVPDMQKGATGALQKYRRANE